MRDETPWEKKYEVGARRGEKREKETHVGKPVNSQPRKEREKKG